MSAKAFGSINLISGLIFLFLGVVLAGAGYSAIEDLFDYGDIEAGIMMLLTGYLFIIFGLWGILCGIVAVVVGFIRPSQQ